MRERLPVNIENYTLPMDKTSHDKENNNNSYGYVSIMFLLSLLITLGCVISLIVLGS